MKLRRLRYSFILIMAVFSTTIQANDEIVKKPFATSYHSFSVISNLIVVQAELGGIRGNYIFDTGSTGLVLNADHQTSMSVSDKEVLGADASVISVYQKHVKRFQFGNITKRHFTVACLPLSHIEASMNMPIAGLIGMDMFQGAAIVIDYSSKMLILADPSANTSADIELDIEMISGVPTIKSEHGGYAMNLAIDFGATCSILDIGIAEQLELNFIEQIDLLTANGTTSALDKVECKNLQLGSEFQFDTAAIVADLSHLQSEDESIHGIIGLDLLKVGKVMFNPVSNSLSIWTSEVK